MSETPEVNNALLFATYAGQHFERWKLEIGQTVQHTTYGEGKVIDVLDSGSGAFHLKIAFKLKVRSYFAKY